MRWDAKGPHLGWRHRWRHRIWRHCWRQRLWSHRRRRLWRRRLWRHQRCRHWRHFDDDVTDVVTKLPTLAPPLSSVFAISIPIHDAVFLVAPTVFLSDRIAVLHFLDYIEVFLDPFKPAFANIFLLRSQKLRTELMCKLTICNSILSAAWFIFTSHLVKLIASKLRI